MKSFLLVVLVVVLIALSRFPRPVVSLSSAKGGSFDVVACEPDAQGNINQDILTNKGSTDDFDWAEATGCVSRPILETWAVTHNPDEMGFSDKAQAVVQAIVPPPAGSTHLYRVNYTVDKGFITVSWTLDWLHQLIQGQIGDPQEVLITISKSGGSSMIEHVSGYLHLIKTSPTVTQVLTRIEVKAPSIDQDEAAKGLNEAIGRLRTGTPYWDGLAPKGNVDFD